MWNSNASSYCDYIGSQPPSSDFGTPQIYSDCQQEEPWAHTDVNQYCGASLLCEEGGSRYHQPFELPSERIYIPTIMEGVDERTPQPHMVEPQVNLTIPASTTYHHPYSEAPPLWTPATQYQHLQQQYEHNTMNNTVVNCIMSQGFQYVVAQIYLHDTVVRSNFHLEANSEDASHNGGSQEVPSNELLQATPTVSINPNQESENCKFQHFPEEEGDISMLRNLSCDYLDFDDMDHILQQRLLARQIKLYKGRIFRGVKRPGNLQQTGHQKSFTRSLSSCKYLVHRQLNKDLVTPQISTTADTVPVQSSEPESSDTTFPIETVQKHCSPRSGRAEMLTMYQTFMQEELIKVHEKFMASHMEEFDEVGISFAGLALQLKNREVSAQSQHDNNGVHQSVGHLTPSEMRVPYVLKDNTQSLGQRGKWMPTRTCFSTEVIIHLNCRTPGF